MVYEAYNLSGMGNASGIVSLIQTVNSELMFDFFGIGMLLSIFLISFFAFLASTGNDASKSLASASFISFALSLPLMILGLIPEFAVILCLIVAGISVVFIKSS